MSPELISVAEAYKRHLRGEPSTGDAEFQRGLLADFACSIIDSRPLTEETLREMGFVERHGWWVMRPIEITLGSNPPTVLLFNDHNVGRLLTPQPTTVGELRLYVWRAERDGDR